MSLSKIIPRPGDGELGKDDPGHAGLDDDADDRLEAHDDDRDLALLLFSQNSIGPPSAAITRVSRGMKSSHMSLMYSPESSSQALLAACCITWMLVYGSVPMRFTK